MVTPVSQLVALITGGAPQSVIDVVALRIAGLSDAEARSIVGLLPQTQAPEPPASPVGG